MTFGIQAVFDCADPDKLARLYAEAPGYMFQDPPEGGANFVESPDDQGESSMKVEEPAGLFPVMPFAAVLTMK